MNKQLLSYYYYSGGNSVDTSYRTLTEYATAQGYTLPSAAQQEKQNTFVESLKSSGIWDLLDVLYVFATDGNNDYATLNWKSPTTFKISRAGTVTFTANQGYNSNGTTGYLQTGWNPSTNGINFTLNSASLTTYLYNHVTENKYDLGVAPAGLATSPLLYLRGDDGFGSHITSINQAGNAVYANGGNCVGFWQTQRRDASNNRLFKNGSQVDTEADASTSLPNGNLVLLGVNVSGSPSFFSTKKMSIFAAGASLSGLESAFYTHWNTYFTSL